ncbi:hypothetical protein [Phocaeicola plebeius]|jgi:hypothetical protein|uniref:Uncharacterized protein n=1 Tax=Phocaeicola plebeius TaxID=310297 RepID=A0A3E4WFJ6_9BACT|nr:hypothetical protein [Phocaeicola plebeius]RGM40996.1 hypothetical protein DXC17_06435 [Phocaeicola plebeius]RGZ52424.1 hypothetical protein DW982_16175 [Phocaeicola plebeius]RHF93331.1 hypothetical protein DW653_00190 [Phocaeicola plebeius]RHJ67597.1 hypothetical protein DW110_02875 [Phocaeicola plebeius]
MKKDNWALGLGIASIVTSFISIMLWLCKYEPITWTLLDTIMTMLSLIVAIISVLFAFNMFGLRKELKNEIDEKLKEISDNHVIHTAKTMMYMEMRLLHLATELSKIDDIRQSIYMMLDTTEKTKNKKDVDYIINQLRELEKRYGDRLFDDTFKGKLRIRLEKVTSFSDSALLFLQNFKV